MHLTSGTTETELIGQCKKGSLKHQEMLYRHYYGFVMGVALRYCPNRDDAMEAVNDSFIKVFNAMPQYDVAKPFKAWLRTITVNTAIDRRRKEMKHLLTAELEDTAPVIAGTFIVETMNARDILKLMDALPDLQRTVFNLYEIDGYSHDEIAEMLGVAVPTSRVYLTRAKEKLRNLLTAELANERGRIK